MATVLSTLLAYSLRTSRSNTHRTRVHVVGLRCEALARSASDEILATFIGRANRIKDPLSATVRNRIASLSPGQNPSPTDLTRDFSLDKTR